MRFLSNPFELNSALRPARGVLWLTLLSFIIAFVWAKQADIDQITRAQGQVIPSSNVLIIQTEIGGVVSALPYEEGALVELGDLLIEFDSIRAEADLAEISARHQSTLAKLTRLQAEVLGEEFMAVDPEIRPQFMDSQRRLFEQRVKSIDEEISASEKILDLVREEIALNGPLVALGDVSQTEVLRLRRQEAELEAKIVTVKNRYFQDAHAEYAQVEEEYERLRQLLVQKQRALSQSRIPAPSRGLITNTRVNMIGSVVRPGDPLMELVPIDDELIVEVKVATSDIGFLEEGQLGVIKVDAFDYTIYGDLEGELIYISADAVDEETPQGLFSYYKVKVKARTNRFSKSPRSLVIIPGMSVTVEIRTGSSSVLEYMLKPIVKTLSESLTER